MKFFHSRIVLSLVFLLLSSTPFYSQQAERDAVVEQKITDELRVISPESVEFFQNGTAKMDAGELEEAMSLYRKVLDISPNFEPAMRRLGSMLVAAGKREEGLKLCQRAVDLNRSPENLFTLVGAKLDLSNPNGSAPKETWTAVFDLIKEANQKKPDDEYGQLLLAEASLRAEKMDDFERAVSRLDTDFPNNPTTNFYKAIRYANVAKFDEAITEAKVASSKGYPEDETARLISAIETAKAEAYPLTPYIIYIYGFLGLVALWALGLLALFLFGRMYSARTLKTIDESDPNDATLGAHASLKNGYRKLVTFGGIYYYISLPVVMLLIVFGTGGVIYGSFAVGRIPIYLILGLIFVGAWSIFSFLKVLVIRPKVEDPGRVLEKEEAPKLWKLVRQVASDVNTRQIDEIRLTLGAELAVYERGTFRSKMNDNAERILILGAASLNGFSANAFRAVLAHEYGHFSNRDTAGGNIAHRVNLDLLRTADVIVENGANTYHNLAFHFLRLYHFLFRRITHGSSRLQEVLADRVAIGKYGAKAFKEGLTHVIRREIEFNVVTSAELDSSFNENRKLKNVYDLAPTTDRETSDIDMETEAVLNRQTTEDDSHPSPADRFVQADRIVGQSIPDISGTVWELFADRNAITTSISEELDRNVRSARYGDDYDMLGH